ncbi:STAS domain-containing protein [Gracilibacillus kekensis]|uniref:Anti-sigma factor antagonist n=1 Tax=Gracilibacillus kekensis TaxID=1027249 RepID=A0A1M7MI22_9BACI|nr:STAS domain-containing protein [Gracilibacillus kekensis]SHM90463.1 anti-sigma B factor antagonist/stage II sporulation protein AA (anti-sigma F factor antagonist) [Gracilibacillus kekensis]
MLEYQLEKAANHCTVSLNGDFDIESTELVNEILIPELRNQSKVHLNFQKVDFIDSSGMGLLIRVVTQLKEENQKVKILNVKEDILEVFELVQIPEIIGKEVIVK